VTRIVVDASAVIPWFIEEEFSQAARSLLDERHERVAPELLLSEVSHGLLKRVRGRIVTRSMVERALVEVAALIAIRPAAHLTLPAFDIGLRFDRSAYDALYVAFAIDQGCQLVTADRRLYNATNRAFPQTMVWVEDAASLA
jgi:predicted nucleic acid-binding protein